MHEPSEPRQRGGGPKADAPSAFSQRRQMETLVQLIEDSKDDAPFEENQYRAYVRQKIDRGLADVEAGRILSEEAFDIRMAKWLEA
jgi:predicted transcriptional regulator